MIKKEEYMTREDGVILFRTYSDTDHYIHKVGTDEIYEEAIDVESAPYVYEETEDIIERHPEDEKTSFEEEHAERQALRNEINKLEERLKQQ